MKSKIIMIGFLVDQVYFDTYTKSDANPQIAARKLEIGYLSGFIENGLDVEVFGFFPSSTFPANRKITFGSGRWEFSGMKCHRVPFINLLGLKFISRTLSMVGSLIYANTHINSENKICIYSTHTPLLIAAYLMNISFKMKFFVVIPDLPTLMNVGTTRGRFFKIAKRIDAQIAKFLISKSSGIAAVTKYIAADMTDWNKMPAVVIEGIHTETSPEIKFKKNNCRQYFLYSGGLSESYGVGCLVRAFVKSDLDADLWICGKGPLAEFVEKCQSKDARIKYLGFIDQTTLNEAQKNATALLLTRNPQEQFVKYSFPSKLIEYMATGTPVITTRLPGIPSEYFDHVYSIESASEGDIINSLRIHLDRNEADLFEQGLRAKEFIKKRCNPKRASSSLIEIMDLRND